MRSHSRLVRDNSTSKIFIEYPNFYRGLDNFATTQSTIIGAVRGAHSQVWGTIIPACSPYAPRKYEKRFGTPAIV